MDNGRTLRELLETSEWCVGTVGRRARLWQGIVCCLAILALLPVPLPLVSGQQDSLEVQKNHFNSPESHLTLKRIGKNFIVSSGLMIQTLSPSIAYNREDNEYMVVWFDLRNEATTGNDIFGQRVSAKGRLRGDNISVSIDPEAQIDPSIAYSSTDNSYLISWRSQLPDPFFNDAFGRIVSNKGMFTGAESHILDVGFEISTAYNSQDNNYLVTSRNFGQVVSHLGFLIGDELEIPNAGPNGQVVYNPHTNEYFTTWRDQSSENLKGQRISAHGDLIGNPVVISSAFPESSDPTASVAFDSKNDRYLVVFAVFQEPQVLGQFVSSSGVLIGTNFPILTLDSRETPSIVYSRIHNVYFIVWRNANDILARLLSETGAGIGNTLFITRSGTARDM